LKFPSPFLRQSDYAGGLPKGHLLGWLMESAAGLAPKSSAWLVVNGIRGRTDAIGSGGAKSTPATSLSTPASFFLPAPSVCRSHVEALRTIGHRLHRRRDVTARGKPDGGGVRRRAANPPPRLRGCYRGVRARASATT